MHGLLHLPEEGQCIWLNHWHQSKAGTKITTSFSCPVSLRGEAGVTLSQFWEKEGALPQRKGLSQDQLESMQFKSLITHSIPTCILQIVHYCIWCFTYIYIYTFTYLLYIHTLLYVLYITWPYKAHTLVQMYIRTYVCMYMIHPADTHTAGGGVSEHTWAHMPCNLHLLTHCHWVSTNTDPPSQLNLSIVVTIGTQLAVLYTVEPLYRGHHWDPTGCPVYSGTSL